MEGTPFLQSFLFSVVRFECQADHVSLSTVSVFHWQWYSFPQDTTVFFFLKVYPSIFLCFPWSAFQRPDCQTRKPLEDCHLPFLLLGLCPLKNECFAAQLQCLCFWLCCLWWSCSIAHLESYISSMAECSRQFIWCACIWPNIQIHIKKKEDSKMVFAFKI